MRTSRSALLATCGLYLAAVSGISHADPGNTPSFSCTAANLSPTEIQICGNPELSGYDRELAGIYVAKLQNAGPAEKQPLMQDQQAWLQKRNACGTGLDCIKGAYLTRIYQLQTAAVPAAGGDQAAQLNAAIPLSGAAQAALALARHRVADKAMLAGIEAQFRLKMNLRALNCAQSLGIGTGLSNQQLHDRYAGDPCFAKQDDDIANWLGMRTVGYILTLPPLRPLPASAPQDITDRAGNFWQVYFAAAAGVAVMGTTDDIEVVDLGSGTPISSIVRPGGTLRTLSPNGRIFVTSDGNGARSHFYESETGTALADPWWQDYGTGCGFPWLDQKTTLSRDAQTHAEVIYDLGSGVTAPLDDTSSYFECVVPVPGAGATWVGFGNRAITQFKLVHGDDGKPHAEVLQGRQVNLNVTPTILNSGLDSFGRQFLYSTNDDLVITNLDDLSTQIVDFGAYAAQRVTPTSDPDKVIISGTLKHQAGAGNRSTPLYVYSIKAQTVSLIDSHGAPNLQFVYAPALNALYQRKDSTLERVDRLDAGAPQAISSFWAQAPQPEPQMHFPARSYGESTAVSGTNVYGASATQAGSDSLHQLAQSASVEGAGFMIPDTPVPGIATVVQPSTTTPPVAHVKLFRRRAPLVLVLSSNTNVVWQLDGAASAQLVAVLISGASGASVQGQGNVQVVNIGSAFTTATGYRPDESPGYSDLQKEVFGYTGRHMSMFQGGGAGTQFNIY